MNARKKWKSLIALSCIAVLFVSFLTYACIFMRDTQTVEQCLAYPYGNASKIERMTKLNSADNNRVTYLSTENSDGIQEMYLLKNKRFLHLFDVQRYIVLEHNASVMEEVGFFPDSAPSDSKTEPTNWYFYSQNDLQLSRMACTFNSYGAGYVTETFTCEPNAPFVCCIPEVKGNLRLESMVGYDRNGEVVFAFNTGLFVEEV